jgi:hypothetical protein
MHLFPQAPVADPEGAGNGYSRYLHLVVCDHEFQALTISTGEAAARRRLSRKPYNKWIYKTIWDDPRVRQLNNKYGFVIK